MISSTGAIDERRGRVQSLVDAWNAHDGAAVVSYMTDDVVYTNLGTGEHLEGQAAVREYVDGMGRRSSDYRFELGLVLGDDESYAVEWTLSGTNDGADERRGLPATGQRFRIPGVTVGRVRDGKIAEHRVYWNLADYLQQVGLMPTSASSAAATS
jgi:steroid delta-isomerase-like uncharacterized protein